MASWLELICNVIGYGGFVVLASHHPRWLCDEAPCNLETEDSGRRTR
jgi:hypothetical protein